MNYYPKIKEGLLKSGLPLESMVARSLASLSSELPHPLINMGEYLFEKPESTLPHSVDFLFTNDLDVKSCDFLQLVFLIECKYRTRGTTWFFAQNPQNDAGMEFFVENYLAKGKCDRRRFPSLAPPLGRELPLAGKGIEVYSTGQRNEKSIREGIHQLMFAASNMLIRAFLGFDLMKKTMRGRGIEIEGRSFHSLICPILTTSAKLHFLKGMTIEEIEKSKKLQDIGETEDMIVTSSPKPPPYIRRYITEDIFENAISMLKESATFIDHPATRRRIKDFLLEYSLLCPSRYYILNYQNIQEFVQEYISFAEGLLILGHEAKDPKQS